MTTEEAAIRSLLDRRSRATSAKDGAGSLAAFAADVVKYDIAPPLAVRGEQANDPEALEQWFASWQGPIGEHTDIWIRSTICLEKRAGAWQIVHEHTSVPLRMDGSGQAATDLKP